MRRRAFLALALASETVGLSAPTAARGAPAAARGIAKLKKEPRLPVWPVVNGLVCTLLDVVGLKEAAAEIEEKFGGRVAPMALEDADPFILLVHHRHAFSPLDPVRPLFRLLLPEGFPSHPHRGFETVTMTKQGGLRHRDSLGVRQDYADGDVQWLTAGKGILHEEMWQGEQCELFQLWLNLPRSAKDCKASTIILRKDEQPVHGDDVREIRLGGVLGNNSEDDLGSPFHDDTPPFQTGPKRDDVRLSTIEFDDANSKWTTHVPADATVLLYCRRGSVQVSDNVLNQYDLAYTEKGKTTLKLTALKPHTDVLFLCGLPLKEPVRSYGTWVMSSDAELARADADYRAGRFGLPWDHDLTDDEWKDHVHRNGPAF